jgi:signal transduction histidine kinase
VVQVAINRLSHHIDARCVQIDVQPNLPDVQGYAPWLEDVFANLLDNAVKYAGADNLCPTIQIGGQRQPDGMVRLTVADNGIGIPPDKQDQVFDMFTRFSRGTAQGSGLGLSIVGRIVTRLGGETGVESREGRGSTFWFTLPAA